MGEIHRLDRRTFLVDCGRRGLAVALLGTGVVACSSSSDGETVTTTTVRSTTTVAGRTTTTVARAETTGTAAPTSTTAAGEALRWERVSFDFVSAYVVARGNGLAIVDTGVSGGADRFDEAFRTLGGGWTDVGDVVLTHLHPDHVGGLGEVLAAAPDARAHAGEADVAGIDSPRPLGPLVDGDEVFGLQVVATPGHTAGHISVFDTETGVLVVGDALTGDGAGIGGPNPSFSADHEQALASARALADLGAHTVLFGHGDPVEGGAAPLLADLAARL